eukprot:10949_1
MAISEALCVVICLFYMANSQDPTLGVWTVPPRNVPSSKEVDGPLLGNGDIGVVLGGKKNNILTFFIGKNDFWYFGANAGAGKNIMGLGGINFTLPNNTNKNYRLEQHSDNGYILFNVSSITGNATVHQNSNTLIINFDSTRTHSINYSLFCWNSSTKANTFYGNNKEWCRRDSTSPVIFASAAIAFNITSNKNTFVVSVVSNFDVNSDSTHKIVSTAVNNAATLASNPAKIEQIWVDNNKWFNAFWNLSAINIPAEPLIMQYWYKSLYMQGIANRENKFAPGLWGPFVTTDTPAWNGDYTLNYNFEAPYYGVYGANHINIATPYYVPVLQYVKQGIINAQSYNCSNSVHYPGHIAPFGFTNSGDMGQHSDASFAALNFVNHFRYTFDNDFVTKNNNEVYNFLKLVCNWWICWLDRYKDNINDVYNDCYDCTRENCMGQNPRNNTNPAISISYIMFILQNMIEMNDYIGLNNSDIAKYKDILAHLAPIPIGMFMNTSVLLPQESPYYFKPGDNPLQLYGIWPGEQIGSDNNILSIGQNTVDKVASWEQGNSYCEMYPSAVRVGYNISKILYEWNGLLKSHMPANGYVNMNGGGMDGSGAIIAVNELLLQSWNNKTMRFFPVYNFGNASFNNLRAVGAFLVSAEMVSSVIKSPIIVYSEKGNICMFMSPWKGNVKVCQISGNQCTIQVAVQCDNSYLCEFKTSSSTGYQLYSQ